jgi:hypothetical protein
VRTDHSFLSIEGIGTSHESPGRIYSLLMKERREASATYPDLSTVLRLNDPSQAEDKLRNDSLDSIDPVVDHLMNSRAFRVVIKGFIVAVLVLGMAVFASGEIVGSDIRLVVLGYGGFPVFFAFVPLATAMAFICSHRLR